MTLNLTDEKSHVESTRCLEVIDHLKLKDGFVDTQIGPVLDVIVCYHQGRYGVEIMIESPVGDTTCSRVRMAREMGSPRQVLNRRRRAREGTEPACVLSPLSKVAHGRTNILPWYCLVGVVQYFQ